MAIRMNRPIGPRQWHPTENTVYPHSFSSCCSPYLRNSPKIRTYSRSGSSKVIDLGAYRKHSHYKYWLWNWTISYRFRDTDAFCSKIACFSPPHPCLTPPSGGTPGDINVIYTPLKSTFNGLQFRRW